MSEFRSPAVQAVNLIQFIGDEISNKSGKKIAELTVKEIEGVTGTGGLFAVDLFNELMEKHFVKGEWFGGRVMNVNLTLDGWNRYEAEKRGQLSGNYGFIAMEFGDTALDPFVQRIVKPAVKEGIGYDLVDMRDVARAGVIDNIMRTQIRDAAFVIVDLTHDNPGAYWEAGYAEGLGKPVIYICEKEKFEAKKTHFDTNHCTTVPWARDDKDGFCRALIATLRRSLDLSS